MIFGLGLNQGGVGAAKFFASAGSQVRVTDLKNADDLKSSLDELKPFSDIEYTLGEHKDEDIDWADIIIKNPAVKPGNPYIEYAKKTGKEVETDMGIFLQHVSPSQIIGVTGTKGKSTTSSLIYEILKAAGEKVLYAGNIGTSVLEILPNISKDTLVVLELSSFQLESFDEKKVSPQYAVITNIYPDHLNYYSSMEEYINAKRIIGKYQDGVLGALFLRKNDPVTTQKDFLKGLNGQIHLFHSLDLPKDFHPSLQGDHNKENMAAALKVAHYFSVDKNLALKVISEFKGVPFRMEKVLEWKGIKIYNDSAATNPDATIQALRSLEDQTIFLICGGMNKGLDYDELGTEIYKIAYKVFYLEGDATEEIRKSQIVIAEAGPYNDLEKLLEDLKKEVQTGNVILFSPGATSFNLFQNEFDRGRKFNAAVEKVFK